MKTGILKFLSMTVMCVIFSVNANADVFWKYGKIKRILAESVYHSGCMVLLDVQIDNGCDGNSNPEKDWVSLDCKGLFYADRELNAQKLSNAMAAAHSGKTVGLYIDNTKKANGYCVARRIDVLF